MTRSERWDRLLTAVGKDIPGFRIAYKDESKFQRFLNSISFFNDYMSGNTTLYPVIYFENRKMVYANHPVETLEHEWVHLKDAKTFFGLLPFMPSWVNSKLFYLSYLFPQILAVGVLLIPLFPAFFLCAFFFLPLPAPFRMWAEIRAYRRSLELSTHKKSSIINYTKHFTSQEYFFMWPFKNQIIRLLQKPSPYKEEMDAARKINV